MKLFIAMLFAPALAVAQVPGADPLWPYFPLCQLGSSFDSYGLGLRSGFRGVEPAYAVSEKWVVEACLKEGQRRGEELARTQDSFCQRDWEEGFAQGFDVTLHSAGRVCYAEGYTAGMAYLRIGARRGLVKVVGEQCVALYAQGLQDVRAGRARWANLGSVGMLTRTRAQITACYDAGYDAGVAGYEVLPR